VLANAAYVSLEFTKGINLGDFVAEDYQAFLVQALTDPV